MSWTDIFTGRDRNKELRAQEKEQRKALKKQARAEYSFAKDQYKADKKNYLAERDYAYETAVTNWEYGKQIQDQQYARSLAAYEKSESIYKGKIDYLDQAESLAVSDEQASIQDLALSQAFQREAMHDDLMNEIKRGGIQKLEQGAKLYGIQSNRRISSENVQENLNQITKENTFEKEAKFVEGLQKSGRAALGQAGVSRKKTLQSTAAQSFRDLTALSSSLSGARNKAAIDLLKLQVDASLDKTQVGLNLDRIELGINAAKDEVKYNNKILAANMQSAVNQMERNIQEIELQKQNAALQAEAERNLFPEKFDYAPEPQITPKRKFVKPIMREVYVPKGPRVDTGFAAVAPVALQAASFALGPTGGAINKGLFNGTGNTLFGFPKITN